MLSNGLVGMSGAGVPGQKYADIQMGTGAIVIGLAAIVIGRCSLAGSATLPLSCQRQLSAP